MKNLYSINKKIKNILLISLFTISLLHSRNSWAGWDDVPEVLSRINAPEFPSAQFDITQYGAKGDGITDCTGAIKKAIDACSLAGGGRVVVPSGKYLTGAIHLKTYVNLYISKGAILLFIPDPARYLPEVYTRWEGIECMNYSPLIYAFEQENIAVTGEGILDGQADNSHWWPWCGSPIYGGTIDGSNQTAARKRLFKMGEENLSVRDRLFGENSFLRPNFIQFYKCRNILIEGVILRNSPMWNIHPVLCTNVIIRKVSIVSHGPNNDGCNPESCSNVLIEDSYFDTGDDCIAVKSGRNRDGRRLATPSQNIIIRNCIMKDGHGGVTIGSEASGGVRNIYAENCMMDSPNLERALRIKTNSVRGGFIENVYMRNVTVGQVSDAVLRIDLFYEEGDKGAYPPVVKNIEMMNVTSRKSRYALYLRGYLHNPITNVRILNCTFENSSEPDVIENVDMLTMDQQSLRQ